MQPIVDEVKRSLAEHHEELTVLDVDGDAVYRGEIGEALVDVVDVDTHVETLSL